MPRDADALITAKWAETGSTATPESVGLAMRDGWPATYHVPHSGKEPERLVFNWLFRALTALMTEVDAHGILAWDTSVAYVHPALVFGSDGLAYSSVQNSLGVDPTTDTDKSHWARFGVSKFVLDASAISSGVLDVARIPATMVRLVSPAFTGTPTAPSPETDDDSTAIAPTAFVKAQPRILNGTASPEGTDGKNGDAWVRTDAIGAFAKVAGNWRRLLAIPKWSLQGKWALDEGNGGGQGITEANGEVLVVDTNNDEVYRYNPY